MLLYRSTLICINSAASRYFYFCSCTNCSWQPATAGYWLRSNFTCTLLHCTIRIHPGGVHFFSFYGLTPDNSDTRKFIPSSNPSAVFALQPTISHCRSRILWRLSPDDISAGDSALIKSYKSIHDMYLLGTYYNFVRTLQFRFFVVREKQR